jgi:hypothetical protein
LVKPLKSSSYQRCGGRCLAASLRSWACVSFGARAFAEAVRRAFFRVVFVAVAISELSTAQKMKSNEISADLIEERIQIIGAIRPTRE